MKKVLSILFSLLLLINLTGCGTSSSNDEKLTTVKVGINASATETWEHIRDVVAKDDINLEIVIFDDYVQPNLALAQKEIDINSFQTRVYFDSFIIEHKLDLVPIANTYIAPMGIYSNKLSSIDDLKEKDKVAIPNDTTNNSRALILLQTAGLIKLKSGVDLPTVDDIIENKLDLEIIELAPAQTARSLQDVAIACINNGMAVEAGFIPTKDSIFIEEVNDASEPYINIIAARNDDKDNPLYQTIIEAFQTDETAKVIDRVFNGSLVITW